MSNSDTTVTFLPAVDTKKVNRLFSNYKHGDLEKLFLQGKI